LKIGDHSSGKTKPDYNIIDDGIGVVIAEMVEDEIFDIFGLAQMMH
jgi:hypothetical protein